MVETMNLDTDVEVESANLGVDEETPKEYWGSLEGEKIIKFVTDTSVIGYQARLKILKELGHYVPGTINRMNDNEAKTIWLKERREITINAKKYNSSCYWKAASNRSQNSKDYLRR